MFDFFFYTAVTLSCFLFFSFFSFFFFLFSFCFALNGYFTSLYQKQIISFFFFQYIYCLLRINKRRQEENDTKNEAAKERQSTFNSTIKRQNVGKQENRKTGNCKFT
jgi:Ca2+/Na+ antiporter